MNKKWLALALLFSVHCSLFTSPLRAQEEPEYKMEIGASAGFVNYLGDFNGNLLKNMQPMGSLLAKYRPNPRMAWAFSVGYGKLKGNVSDAETWYPDAEQMEQSFNNSLIDGGVRFEYNFWAYGTGQEYRGARRVAPFFTLGVGVTHADTSDGGIMAMNVPLGAGVKYKVGDRLNLTLEWRMHFTGSDKLDGVADPYTIKSSGLFKNTDCYSMLQLSLTYDILAKCKTCNNDRD